MLANNKPGGDSSSSPSQYDGNAMEIAALHFEALQKYLLTHILKGRLSFSHVFERHIACLGPNA
jgi:hypothetical protein